jgi:hypothetical protein
MSLHFYINIIKPLPANEEELSSSQIIEDMKLVTTMIEFQLKDFLCPNISVFSILSTPFEIVCSRNNNSSYSFQLNDISPVLLEFPMYCVRPIPILNGTETIYAYESPGQLGIGGKIWDSTFILMNYLVKHVKELIENETVVELGSGTGIAGINRFFLCLFLFVIHDFLL